VYGRCPRKSPKLSTMMMVPAISKWMLMICAII
jgi:hypothetical protein